jgi:hypothetical protein
MRLKLMKTRKIRYDVFYLNVTYTNTIQIILNTFRTIKRTTHVIIIINVLIKTPNNRVHILCILHSF